MDMDIDIDIGDGRYKTKSTTLAAYLYMEGFQLLDVDISGFPSVFIFENGKQVQEHVRKFQVAQAEGNLVLFYEAYRKCLRMTRVGKL